MRVVPSAEAVERATECLAGRSRSFADDARYFASVVLYVATGQLGNGVVPAPIEPPAEEENSRWPKLSI